MKVLFVHQNFPGQFPHLSPALAQRGHEVLALTTEKNERPSPVRTVRYKEPRQIKTDGVLGRAYSVNAERGLMAARGARVLRDKHGYTPDVIIGHSGWGETLFLKEIWPEAKLLIYAELMYNTQGTDVGFDPEISPATLDGQMMTVGRSAHLIQGIVQADAAIAPTHYQANTFPPELRQKITVIHDGINTQRACPDPNACLTLASGKKLRAGEEVLSFVSRSLEPYRGFHVFMRALPDVLKQRPDAQVVIVGGDGVSYGRAPKDGRGWKDVLLEEVGSKLDLERVHFVGRLPYNEYMTLMQVARVHCYLTYPFVLSWSLTEAMSVGAYIVASDTDPVREVIRDGENGRLVPFFDLEALASALIHGLQGDPQAERLKSAARQTIRERYDMREICLPKLIEWVESYDPKGL